MRTQDVRDALDLTLADRYEVRGELGSGGMALVYSALDRKHQPMVAIKVMRTESAVLSGTQRFLREINLTANLQHPHILPLLDSGTIDVRGVDVPYYVMPLVVGQSLRVKLDLEGRVSVGETLQIVRDVGQALAFAHDHGIVHRDVKPENILLNASGAAVVADFGVAQAAAGTGGKSLTETGTSVGTPLYMSPEQAFGEGEINPRSDQYSLATVVFEMLAGEAPYYAPSKEAILARRLVEPIPTITAFAPDLPNGLDAAVRKALSRRREDRFATVADFVAALEAGATTPAASAPSPTAVSEVTRPRSRTVRWSVMIGGVIALAAAAALWRTRRSAAVDGPQVVAVLGIENLSRDSTLESVGRIAADWITQGIAQSGMARIVASQTVLQEESRSRPGGPGAIQPRQVARALGATKVITGSYRAIGDTIEFLLQVIDVASGRVDRAIEPLRGSRADLSRTADQVRARALGALALVVDAPSKNRLLALAGSTPKYDAYQEYLKALDLRNKNRSNDAARVASHAHQLDTTFIQPLVLEYDDLAADGRFPEADSVLRIINAHLSSLSPVERAYVSAVTAVARGDYQAALGRLREVDQLAPSGEIKFNIAQMQMGMARYEEALATWAEVPDPEHTSLAENAEFWETAIVAAHRLGRFQQALEIALRGERSIPRSLSLMQEEIFQLVALGRIPQVDSAILRLTQAPEREEVKSAGLVMAMSASELRVHGHPADAKRVAERALRYLEGVGIDDGIRASSQMVLLAELGRWAEVLPLAVGFSKRAPQDLIYIGSAAVSLVRLGRVSEADSVAAVVLKGSWGSPGEREFVMARVTAAKGDQDQAIGWLQRAIAKGYPSAALNFHVEITLDPLRERPDFKALDAPHR